MTYAATIDSAVMLLNERFCKEAPQSAAYKLEGLANDDAAAIVSSISLEAAALVWEEMSPYSSAEIMNLLAVEQALEVLQAIDPGKASSIVSLMDPALKEAVLAQLAPSLRSEFQSLAEYPPDSAGWLMDTRILTFKGSAKVSEALEILTRFRRDLPTHELRIVDDDKCFRSIVDIRDLALADAAQTLQEISLPIPAVVMAMDTKEEIVQKMDQFRLDELAVINDQGHILGVIRHSSLIDAIKEDASVDIQTMVGVSKDESATSSSWLAIRKRMPWLQVNLITAFMAAAVVGIFEDTIAKFTALAVLLPVVAGQSGNAGAQALAVAMRGLALRQIRVQDWVKLAVKEGQVGWWNGIGIAIVCGIGVYLWSGQLALVLVIASSMIIAMVLAGLAGALVPVILTRLGLDPAAASSIVLTTITDIAGFFSFLGIATLLSDMLA